jgi:hypothetical protein
MKEYRARSLMRKSQELIKDRIFACISQDLTPGEISWHLLTGAIA